MVTVMSMVAADTAGVVTTMVVSDSTLKDAAGVLPKVTAPAPEKPLPVSVMVSPPLLLPLLGVTALMLATAGAL